jgi:uncharacterized protein YndB with AHSA1/START domain
MELRTDRVYRFPFAPDELWARINQVDDFGRWWPWLRAFDGTRLQAGDVWTCVVQPPVPYAVRFAVTIVEVVPHERVTATIGGDIIGTAHLRLLDDPGGSRLQLVAELAPRKQSLQSISRFARPLVRFGHNWVLDTGARQFRERSTPSGRDGA